MRKPFALAIAATTLGTAALIPSLASSATAASTATPTGSAYAQAVLKDGPSAFLQGLNDVTGNTTNGTVVGGSTATTLPNGDPALAFNGNGQYAQFSDNKAFEVDNTGVLTAEFWMRPDTLEFSHTESSGYVYTMGKGTGNQHEWYTRMYTKNNEEGRPNRISGYVFNPAGGLGSGSYFQDPVKTGDWIHVALVINSKDTSSAYPMGYVKIYKDGVLRDTDSLKDYNITPKSGSAPLRVGTGYLNSFFQGAMGDIAFFNKELTAAQVKAHDDAMSQSAPTTPTVPASPSGPAAPTTPTTPTAPTEPTIPGWPTDTPAEDSHAVDGTDVRRSANDLITYTPDNGTTTGTNSWGAEATVVDGRITAVENGVGDATIPDDGYVLSGHGTARAWLLEHATIGATVTTTGDTVTITPPASE